MRKSILLLVLLTLSVSFANSLFAQYPSISLKANINPIPNPADTDIVVIYFIAGATYGWDNGWDSQALLNTDVNFCNIYAPIPGYSLGLDGLPPLTGNLCIDIGFKVNDPTDNYTISVSQISNFPVGTKIWLVDTKTNDSVNLMKTPSYSFTFTSSETDNNTRFAMCFDLTSSLNAVNNLESASASSFMLLGNPVNQTANIRYQLPYKTNVLLKVYDITGKEIATLFNDVKAQGLYDLPYDVRNLKNGIYYLSLVIGDNRLTQKLVIIK